MGGCCSGGGGAEGAKNDAGDQERLAFVVRVKLFKRLPSAEHPTLAKAMKSVNFGPGQVIITQGDEGNEFYVIKSGECKVEINGKQVATLRAGDYFGENALLRDEPRTATITAVSQVQAFSVDQVSFQNLGLHTKLDFPKRGAVAGGGMAQVATKPPSPKTKEEEALMVSALKSNENLATLGMMDDQKIQAIISKMWKESVAQGSAVVKQGDLNADYFYIITEGDFEATIAEEGKLHADLVGTLSKGKSFGELALMYFAPRAATVTAKSNGNVFVIDRLQFKEIFSQEQAGKEYVRHLDKVDLLSPLKDNEKESLAKALNQMHFSQNDDIFKQGEEGTFFYILIDGKVDVVKDGKRVAQLSANDKEAQCFGEKALMTNETRAATITVTSPTATTLVVDKMSFDMLLGPLQEIAKRGKNGTAQVKKVGGAVADGGEKRTGNIQRKDLKRLGLLGCGGFGAVELVEHIKTGETYALKALSKGFVVKSGMQSSVMSEKNVQLMCDSQFIIKLYETFNGDQSLYFLIELALGGELYATYNKKGLWGREDCARFYVAGSTFAFEHLHSKKIIFRDLKPENLLLNEKGFMKMTDMGLAKVVIGKTFTTCGTPDYFAPELIASKGHTQAVDWWTLGILTFELLVGHPPFESASPMQIYQKVSKGINKVSFTKKAKGNAESLIKGLCTSNPADRLPMKKDGTAAIKTHPWYDGFDWEKMFNLNLTPPYIPVVKNKKDAGNFSARKEDLPPQLQYKDDKSGWDKNFATST